MPNRTVTWLLRIDMQFNSLDGPTWTDHYIFEVADETFARQQFQAYKAGPLPDHLRNPRLYRVTRELVTQELIDHA